MARRALSSRPTVSSEGGLLPPELLDRIANPGERELPGLDPVADYGLEKSASGGRITEAAARSWEHTKAYWSAFKARLDGARPGTELGITRQQWLLPLLAELSYTDLEFRQQSELIDGREFRISHRATAAADAPPLHLVACTQPLDRLDPASPAPKASPHGLLQSYLNQSDHLWGIVSNGRQLRILRDNASLTRPAYLEFDLEGMMEGGVFADFSLLWMVAHRTRLPKGTTETSVCLLERWYEAALVRGARALGDLRKGVEQATRALGQGFIDHPGNEALRARLASGELDSAGYYRQLLRVVYRLLFLLVAEERDLIFPAGRDAPHPSSPALLPLTPHHPASSPAGGEEETGKERPPSPREGEGLRVRGDAQGQGEDQRALRSRGRAIYAESYSVSRLREQIRRTRGDERHDDLWRAQRVAFGMLRDGNRALGLPPLGGGIFDPRICPDLEDAQLCNDALKAAIRGLSLAPTKSGYRRINYRDLDVEELGSVYESLLDEQPVLRTNGARPEFTLAGGGERKSTGSYYTPSALVQELIRSALEPVIQQALASAPDIPGQRRALLELAVCDPACGSGHFLLAAARRIGRELARLASGEHEPDPAVLRHAIREAITRCVYGVDLNPLAVDLCRLALWLEGHEPGRPLGFLDHHIKLGNSLVGATSELIERGIPSEAFEPVEGDDRELARAVKKQNRDELAKPQLRLFAGAGLEPAGPSREEAREAGQIGAFEEAEPDDVALKESEYAGLSARLAHKRRAADLWTAAFFWPLRDNAPAPPTQSLLLAHRAGRPAPVGDAGERELARILDGVRPFHWELEFPEIFAVKGGFDCMLGNPPWEKVKLSDKEFFEDRAPEIANAPNAAERKRLIDALERDDPPLIRAYQNAKSIAEQVSSFLRRGGRFPLGGAGDVNYYVVFAELFSDLEAPNGRAGVLCPSGIATDDTTKSLFGKFAAGRLASLYDFENRDKLFEGIDSRLKFCLLTLRGAPNRAAPADFAFFATSIDHLREPDRHFTLTAEDFALFNPNTRTCPVFRSKRDAEIARKLYRRAGVFWREAGDAEPEANPWGVTFQRMFDMSNDSRLFRTREELEAEGFDLTPGPFPGKEGEDEGETTEGEIRNSLSLVGEGRGEGEPQRADGSPRAAGNVFAHPDGRAYLPLYEAKLFHQYDHRFATFAGASKEDLRAGNARDMTAAEKADPNAVVIPRYWVPAEEVAKRLDIGENGDIVSSQQSAVSSQQSAVSSQQSAVSDRRPSPSSPSSWLVSRASAYRTSDRSADSNLRRVAENRTRPQGGGGQSGRWLTPIRKTARATDERTAIASVTSRSGMSDRAPLIHAPDAEAAALMVALLNSIVVDFAARSSVGGTDVSYFIIKQLPIPPPDALRQPSPVGCTYAELIVPRALELTYTAWDLEPFARDLGYDGPPFAWDEGRRHRLKCELDAIFVHLYHLDRSDLEWILDAPYPSASFPGLKRNELRQFGEYRTQRYVLHAYDQMARGEAPDLDGV